MLKLHSYKITMTLITKFNFDSFLKSGKRGRFLDVNFKVIPKITSTKRYRRLTIINMRKG